LDTYIRAADIAGNKMTRFDVFPLEKAACEGGLLP
jgi:hypothetical protein